ncbi:MAG TPA: VOC family protein [Pseudomonadales bacterium]|nr:VOC family protein [Pseudomonadales bacterium]
MAFKGIDHVVVRVKDLNSAIDGYKKILGVEPKRASSAALKAEQAFFYFGNGTFLELIQPTDDTSPIAGSLNKLGEGVHTVAFAIDNREATVKDLEAKSVRTIGGAFVHPGAANGVLVQLSEK